MVNYKNSKVYKIWSTQGDNIYIGATTKQYLSQRMDKHRAEYKLWKNGKTHLITSYILFDEYGLDNCFIELLEAKECNTKDELKQIEGKYIRELTCVNKRVEGRSNKEYYEDNKESLLEYQHTYYKNNSVKVTERNKQYVIDHKEQILEYQKQYKEENKVKISEQLNQVFNCDCGINYTYRHKSRHLKTKKHCQLIESKTT